MLTKYHQTRDESAVILKRVIAELGQHDAPFDPTTFSVWYELYAGLNPALTLAVEQRRQFHARLSAEDIEALYLSHVAAPDAEATRHISGQIERVMASVAQQAKATGDEAQQYGHQLKSLSQVLLTDEADPGATAMSPHWDRIAVGTDRMQATVAALAHAVEEGHAEIERLRLALERSRIEAITDPLSLLLNRKGFDKALRATLARPAAAGTAHCLIILDIDHFKQVNDKYGHLVGDTVIQTLGQLLQRKIQGPGIHAARIGGEEFAVLMESTTMARTVQVAHTIRELVRGARIRRRGSSDLLATISVSAGIAQFGPGDDSAKLMAAADAALYRSKQNGRDCVNVA